MSYKNIWVIETAETLNELGGHGTLEDIYSHVEARNNIKLSDYIDWKAQIRKNIYLSSSDTEIFKGDVGDINDIFYAIEGKGKGKWGLRHNKGL